MAIQSKEFVGIAEGIKTHELSTKSRIESLQGTIFELSGVKMSLDSQIMYLEAALVAAYEDTDEDGNPNYGRIAAIEAQISETENELSEIERQINDTNSKLLDSEAEFERVMEEKAQTLFEIQERARKTSNNIAVAGGMYGAYSGIGGSLQSSMQTSMTSLSRAASILDGSVDRFSVGSSCGSGDGSVGDRGTFSQGNLSTSSLGAFAVNAATSSKLIHNTLPVSTLSSFTTNHTDGITPATTQNFHLRQQLIEPQRTLNFNTYQRENLYATTVFSTNGETESLSKIENYRSLQTSSSIESYFANSGSIASVGKDDFEREDIMGRRSWAQQYKVGFTPTVHSSTATPSSDDSSMPNRGQREVVDELEREFALGALTSKFAKGKNGSQLESITFSSKSSEDIRSAFIQRLQAKVELVIRPISSTTFSGDDDISIEARVRERKEGDYERDLLSKFGLGYKEIQTSFVDAKVPIKPKNQILVENSNSYSQLLKEPRSLSCTAEGWMRGAGNTLTYNCPIETGKKLDYHQGKVENFQGTCGLVSCVNILRMAGVPVTEADVVKYASTTYEENTNSFVAYLMRRTLCTTNSAPSANGGTSATSRKKILEHFGIPSYTAPQSIETIAQAVSSGQGVIASIHAERLYFKRRPIHPDLHAITITSVQKDTTGKILGFYVCDSNAYILGGTGATYYTADELEEALSDRECNITTTIIR